MSQAFVDSRVNQSDDLKPKTQLLKHKRALSSLVGETQSPIRDRISNKSSPHPLPPVTSKIYLDQKISLWKQIKSRNTSHSVDLSSKRQTNKPRAYIFPDPVSKNISLGLGNKKVKPKDPKTLRVCEHLM